MTLIGGVGALRSVAVVAAAPQSGDVALGIGEDARGIDHAGLARIVERNLDHVDTEERGAWIARNAADAAGQFFFLADTGSARIIDDDGVVLVGQADDGVGVRSAAGLDDAGLTRTGEVADVEDAQSLHPVGAYVLVDAAGAAVDPAQRLLDAHDERVADQRDVALAAGADDRADEVRHSFLVEAIDVEAVIIADHEQVVAERHVGVAEGQHRSARDEPGRGLFALARFVFGVARPLVGRFLPLVAVDRAKAQFGGVVGIEKAGRFGQGGDEFEVHRRLSGVLEARGQVDAGIDRQARELGRHARDLGVLVADQLVDEFV